MSRNQVINGSLVPIAGYMPPDAGGGGGTTNDNFIGTRVEWDALSASQKQQYRTVDITDDVSFTFPIDDALSTTSERAVQNKVVTNALNEMSPKVGIGWFDVNLEGVAVTNSDAGGYYASVSINSSVPTGTLPINVCPIGGYTGGAFLMLQCQPTNSSWYIVIGSGSSFTFPANRKARVFYVTLAS